MKRVLALHGSRLRAAGCSYDLRRVGRVRLIGAGKASVPMARAVASLLGARLESGVIVTSQRRTRIPNVEVIPAGHPIPTAASVRAAKRVLKDNSTLTASDLLIVVLSGGASSLLSLPEHGLTLDDKRRTTKLLLRSGATIAEINTVRKHLSAVKGGRLAEATPANILTLILSDVAGDDLAAIGSGPTVADPTTFKDAVGTLRRHGLWQRLPVRVRVYLVEGLGGWRPETPKPRSRIFQRTQHVIIGNNRTAIEAAGQAARSAGYDTIVLDQFLTGEACEAARWMAGWSRTIARGKLRRPVCLVAGGELTVTVTGRGLGGRAQEFALAAALALQGTSGIWAAAIGTDGRDGPTDAAGAMADGQTVARGRKRGANASAYLKRHDSYHFFKKAGGHITTGLTGTNVNDLYLMLIHPPQQKSK